MEEIKINETIEQENIKNNNEYLLELKKINNHLKKIELYTLIPAIPGILLIGALALGIAGLIITGIITLIF